MPRSGQGERLYSPVHPFDAASRPVGCGLKDCCISDYSLLHTAELATGGIAQGGYDVCLVLSTDHRCSVPPSPQPRIREETGQNRYFIWAAPNEGALATIGCVESMTIESPSSLLLPDNPIVSSQDDVLEWTPLATEFARRILEIDATQGLVVGLFGSWGSGKTSFINLARPSFRQEGIPVLDFNPWLYSGAEQLLRRFFSELSAAAGELSDLDKIRGYLKQYGELLDPAIVAASTLVGTPQVGTAFSTLHKYLCKRVSRRENPHSSAVALRKKLTEALEQRGKPIVVVLDDVDRLSRDEIRELFRLVRLTASFPNLIYIVACDRVHVEDALEDNDTRVRGNYLEKIFQWSVDIPTAPHRSIRRELLAGIENALGDIAPPFDDLSWPDIETEVIRPLVRNMRDVRRYTMAVRGTVDDLGTSIALVDILALEAVRLFLPRLFQRLPHLIDHLTVPPTWEGNAQRVADIISEQMDDAQKAVELRQAYLEEVLEELDAQDRPVARALVHRVFSGGRERHDDHDSQWPIRQLRNNRAVHRLVFRLYLTRVEDGDLTSSNLAKRAFKCMHDSQALCKVMRSQDSDIWPGSILFLMSMFRNDFDGKHAEPGLVVFWNLLPDMPGRNAIVLDEPMAIVRMMSATLLKTLVGGDSATDTIHSIFQQLQSLTSKVAFLTLIKAFVSENGLPVSDVELREIEVRLNNQILSVNADDLIKERHPAQILLFSSWLADPPGVPHMIHDSPKLTFALILDCLTKSSTSEIGSRATETKHGLNWDNMIAIHSNEAILRTRIDSLDENFSAIKSWIASELEVPHGDALHMLKLAKDMLTAH